MNQEAGDGVAAYSKAFTWRLSYLAHVSNVVLLQYRTRRETWREGLTTGMFSTLFFLPEQFAKTIQESVWRTQIEDN